MTASTSDKLTATFNAANPNVARVTSSRTAGITTLACDNLAGWPTVTKVHFSTYSINTSGAVVAGTQIDWYGIVSGNNIGSLTRLAGATDAGNSIGDVVEMMPTGSWAQGLYDWGTSFADTQGNLSTTAVQTALGLGTASLNGWNALGYAPNTVTYNGNRSYDLTFNANDLTTTLSAGMRLRTTRTVAAPTQSTSLNGTTQYYSKSSPAGMTFTNNFVVGAWIKLNSYPTGSGSILSRFDGSNGWDLNIQANGTVNLVGFNAASGNYSQLLSYQSIPLNKWVHIAAQLDMSTFTATPTTSYAMIDGVDVPVAVSRGGTNPTALALGTGAFQIGARNSALFFPGKIAQAFVSSAKITQANVRTLISQGLTSALITANSIISAYSFDGVITDLNTTNANNLTPNGSAVATNADSPFGTQASGSISSTLDYAEIVSSTYSTNTTISVRVPAGNTIPTSGGVFAVVYSSNAYPYGFPGISKILAFVPFASNYSTSATAPAQVPGLTATVTIPNGGKQISVEAYVRDNYSTGTPGYNLLGIWDGTVGTGVAIAAAQANLTNTTGQSSLIARTIYVPTPGSHTFNVSLHTTSGTTNFEAAAQYPAYLLVRIEE